MTNEKGQNIPFFSFQAHLLSFLIVAFAAVVIIAVVVGEFVVATVSLLNTSTDLQKPHDFEQKACMNAFEIVQWPFCTSVKQSCRWSTHGWAEILWIGHIKLTEMHGHLALLYLRT